MSVSIGLDAVRELRQPRICREFGPTSQVEVGLRLEIGQFDRDRHARKIRQKWIKTTIAKRAKKGTAGLIKQMAALGGDRITIDAGVVRLNGVLWKNGAPCASDEAGRPLQAYELSDYQLGADEMLLMSDYSPASFDGRYFVPVSRSTIQSVIVPGITWR
jgi:conjugative transfer signal peptidase TraF